MMNEDRHNITVRSFFHSAFIVLTSALLLLCGCAVPRIPARAVYEDPTSYVRLEPDPYVLPEFPQSQHNHPVAFNPAQVETILKGLLERDWRNRVQVWIWGEATWEPVFRDEEIRLLAPRIAEAFGKVRPDERVTFYLSRPQTSIKREITTGGLYVHEDRLHFILGNYRVVYAIPAYGMVYDRRYPMRPIAPKGFETTFVQPEAVIAQPSSLLDRMFGRTKDELVIDLAKLGLFRSVVAGPARPGGSLGFLLDAGSRVPTKAWGRAASCRARERPGTLPSKGWEWAEITDAARNAACSRPRHAGTRA